MLEELIHDTQNAETFQKRIYYLHAASYLKTRQKDLFILNHIDSFNTSFPGCKAVD